MRLEALYINVWNGFGYDDMKNTPPYSKSTPICHLSPDKTMASMSWASALKKYSRIKKNEGQGAYSRRDVLIRGERAQWKTAKEKVENV